MGNFVKYALIFGAGWLVGPFLFNFVKMTLGSVAGGLGQRQ
jgi:hypothetical protein